MLELSALTLLPGVSMAMAGYVALAGYRAFSLPRKRPERFDPRLDAQGDVMVCLGDSLTHGQVSYNYLRLMEKHFSDRSITLVNGGVNGDLAFNLLTRLEAVARCQPRYVTVLIGTNDVVASLSDANRDFYINYKKLPAEPTLEGFANHLTDILIWLQNHTRAHIGVYSLPVLGEQLDSLAHRQVQAYNQAIQQVTTRYNVDYLPLYEHHAAHLAQCRHSPRETFVSTNHPSVYRAMAERHLLWRSYGDIGRRRGFHLTCEGVHMNRQGAEVIARLGIDWVMSRQHAPREQ